MTRINLIEPKDLTNRHLVAEYKEITQFLHLVKKRTDSNKDFKDVPKEFTLNKGHCLFFYNKGLYIKNRFIKIHEEILRRGMNTSEDKFKQRLQKINECYSDSLMNNYFPSERDYKIVIDRISSRINEKKSLYPDSHRFFRAIERYI